MKTTQKMLKHATKDFDGANPTREALVMVLRSVAAIGGIYTKELVEFLEAMYVDDGVIVSTEWIDDEETLLYHAESYAEDLRAVADAIESLVTAQKVKDMIKV